MARATIRDVAKAASVSTYSVHCALKGKTGVSEETRARILEIAKELNYQPNTLAVGLKRPEQLIITVLPGESEKSRFYFDACRDGIRDFFKSIENLSVRCVELPVLPGNCEMLRNQLAELEEEGICGILTTRFENDYGESPLTEEIMNRYPTVLFGNGIENCNPICTVRADHRILGRTLAELITNTIGPEGGILVYAGRPDMAPHRSMTEGFESYLRENALSNRMVKVYHSEESSCRIHELMKDESIKACVSVTARGSLMLRDAIVQNNRVGSVFAIGSDMFTENVDALKSGVFSNLVYKNQYLQAYKAARILTEYLTMQIQPTQHVYYTNCNIIFRSDLSFYEDRGYRLII